ncbi:epsin-2-like isoform X2 [Mytilus californianus]|uniref:epsin-2-like isoform X2 n=1 Tax=Mytilus californianus TaxID=6549 RepID=UPI0022467B5E|nr:epsin-2-like isoform X2 [Mytilus californianus]
MSNMPPIRRTVKNVIHNYSEAQVKVREATSNDPWGPSSTLMSEIADLTYNVVAFTEIMQMIWKRLNDHGKNWRHVYKSLMLLDYIIKTGSEKVAQQCKENIFAIQTLRDFQYREDNKDQGMNVREKAKQLVALLKDDERLRNERAKALKAKERFAQNAMGIGSDDKVRYGRGSPSLSTGAGGGGYTDSYGGGSESVHSDASSPVEVRRRSTDMVEYARPSSAGEEEIQLQLALAMSKEEHDEELKKQKSDDVKLALALEESRKQQDEGQPGGLLSLDSPKALTTDPWGAPIPAPVATTDPWGAPVPAPAPAPPTSDPWQSPARTVSPAQQQQMSSDPWGAPLAMQQAPPPYSSVAASDPWITPSSAAAVQSQPPRQKSPWDASPTMDNTTGFDSGFGMGASAATTNGQKEDDGFDLLSSRSTGNSPAKIPTSHGALDGFDPLGGEKKDPWLLDGMQDTLPTLQQQEQQKHRKTPQEFLGDNANLVNLDQLVTTSTKQATLNPFEAPATSNPFAAQLSNQPARMTLSQLQSNTQGFSQSASSGLLPAPLAPLNTTGPAQPQQQSYNPFL